MDELNRAKKVVKSGKPLRRDWFPHDLGSYDSLGRFSQALETPGTERTVGAFLVAELAIRYTYVDVESPFELDIDYEDPNVHNYEPQREPNIFHAALTIGGGDEWGLPHRDDKARKKFWQWWLNEAVPASWNLEEI